MTRIDSGGELSQHADQAAEAVRAINHATITGPPLPAPVVYDVLGSLKTLGWGLAQSCFQLAARLAASADVYDLYEVGSAYRRGRCLADDRDPRDSVANAVCYLAQAREHARALGVFLEAAQSAIAGQGYR